MAKLTKRKNYVNKKATFYEVAFYFFKADIYTYILSGAETAKIAKALAKTVLKAQTNDNLALVNLTSSVITLVEL